MCLNKCFLKNKWPIIYTFIILLSFLITVANQLYGDEALYAIAIKEMMRDGIRPFITYLGEPVFFKPPLTFIVYSIMAKPFMGMFDERVALRIPSLIFTLLLTFLLHKFLKEEIGDKANIAVLLFLLSMQIFAFGNRLLVDTFSAFALLSALYSTKKYCESKKSMYLLGYILFIVALGLSKAAALSIFGVGLCTLFCMYKNKKPYEMLVFGALSILFVYGFPYLFGEQTSCYLESNVMDNSRIFSISYISFNSIRWFIYMIPIGIVGFALSILNILQKKVGFFDLWALASLITLSISLSGTLPWYLTYFIPAFATVISLKIDDNRIDKIMLWIIVLASSLSSFYIAQHLRFGIINDLDEIVSYIHSIDKNIMVISRANGEFENRIYNPKIVFVGTESSFVLADGADAYLGSRNETMVPENIWRLIYDYENDSLSPKFLHQLNCTEKYVMYGRTVKYFDGPPEVIVAQKYYVESIMSVAPEYKEVYRTKNGEFYVFEKHIKGG